MSITKADITTKYIIEKPRLFSIKGYAATSMADNTKATGLTKVAIYGNFENKDAIAIAAFNKSVNDLLKQIAQHQEQKQIPTPTKTVSHYRFLPKLLRLRKNSRVALWVNVGVNAPTTSLLNKVQEIVRVPNAMWPN